MTQNWIWVECTGRGKHSATLSWRVRNEGDLLAPRQEQSGMDTRSDSFVLLHEEYNGLILFPLKLMAKAPLTLREARLRCAVPFCQVRPAIWEKGIKVPLPKTSVKWNQKLFWRRRSDGREKEDGFGYHSRKVQIILFRSRGKNKNKKFETGLKFQLDQN